MKAVRFAYYLNSECQLESLLATERKEWFDFVRSYKVKQSIIA